MTSSVIYSGTCIHDHKLVGSKIHNSNVPVSWHFKYFVQDMPIYREFLMCRNYLKNTSLSNSKYNTREKIFMSACASNCLTILRNIEHRVVKNEVIIKSLHKGCKNGHLKVAKFLVDKGANIHAGNDWALQGACSNGHLKVAKFLMEKGADIHAENDLAFQNTCEHGHFQVAKFLVEKGADIHAENDLALR